MQVVQIVKVQVVTTQASLDTGEGYVLARARAATAIQTGCGEHGLLMIDDSLCLESEKAFGLLKKEIRAFRAGKVEPHDVDLDNPDAMILGLTLTFSAAARNLAEALAEMTIDLRDFDRPHPFDGSLRGVGELYPDGVSVVDQQRPVGIDTDQHP